MKTPKVKNRPVSVHSRAARRATVSTISSSAALSPEPEYTNIHTTGSGISKKKNAKRMTRQQRLRHQKGLARADANVEKLSKKVTDSLERARKIKHRAAAWDELNQTDAKPVQRKILSSLDTEPLRADESDLVIEDQEEGAVRDTPAIVVLVPQQDLDADEIL